MKERIEIICIGCGKRGDAFVENPVSKEMKTICPDCKNQKCPNCSETIVKGLGHICG